MTEEQAADLIMKTTSLNDTASVLVGVVLFSAGLLFAIAISIIFMGWLRDI